MSAQDPGAASGQQTYPPLLRCACRCLETLHNLTESGRRTSCSSSRCTCRAFAAAAAAIEPVATAYQVCAVPEDEYGNYLSFAISVERTHHSGSWAVRLRSCCLSAEGEWEYEPQPSSREDGWLATHRFDLQTALRRAVEAAPHVQVNGVTVADVLARSSELTTRDGHGEVVVTITDLDAETRCRNT